MEGRQFRSPKGIKDVLPEELPAWRKLEATAAELARLRGFREIRPALLEELELFTRSVGEVTDIVQKEMFRFERRGGSEEGGEKGALALRPEGTAGIVRAYLEAGYANSAPVQRLFHVGPMFRYERPQKGRERMFTQFDVEVIGSLDPRLDAEVIHLARSFFRALGFQDVWVHLNTMGDGDDRARWREALKEFLRPTLAERCAQCQERFERNVLRVLDCKNPRCKELNRDAPTILPYLSPENRTHFDTVCRLVGEQNLALEEAEQQQAPMARVHLDSGLVRGLDYYTRTVFEIHARELGARSAMCGGGRYDHLVADLGGPELGAVGFAVGFTPTLLRLRELGLLENLREVPAEVFVVGAGEGLERAVFLLAEELRRAGIACIYDVEQRNLKNQLKLAGRGGHRFALVLGGAELEKGTVQLKNLAGGEQRELARAELVPALRRALAARPEDAPCPPAQS